MKTIKPDPFEPKSPAPNNRWRRLSEAWLALASLFPLLLYAYMGSFMRLSGDDYCYGAYLVRLGFWRAQLESYLRISTYHGDRYSLTFFSDLAGVLGPKANAVLPGLAILFWCVGIVLILRRISRQMGWRLPGLLTIALASFMIFITLYTTPDVYQSLYWRSAMLPYLAPLVSGIWLLVFFDLSQNLHLWVRWVLVFCLALIAGGFSETGVALQITFCVLALVAVLAAYGFRDPKARRSLLLGLAALSGSLLALLLMVVSPVSRDRLANLPPPPAWLDWGKMVVQFSFLFVRSSLRRLYLPFGLLGLFAALITVLVYQRRAAARFPRARQIGFGLVAAGLAGWLLIAAVFAPSAYAESGYPQPRALILAQFLLVCLVVVGGFCVGSVLAALLKKRDGSIRVSAAVVMFLGLCILGYGLHAANAILEEQPKFSKWARLWDARDQQIRQAALGNATLVHVIQLDHIIPNVGDLSPDPGAWYNNCAAIYYRLDQISADLPGWDP
jgi:hypothetical protein